MAIVIKKRVGFEFLGEEYKDAYLNFKSIPVSEYSDIESKAKQFEKDNEGSVEYMLGLLKKHFIDGKFPNEKGDLEDVKADDLGGLDAESLINCFKTFTGQAIDPKVENDSPTT